MLSGSPLTRPVQVAYAVTDVVTAATRFAASTGAGPFFVIEHVALSAARVHGREGSFDHSSAYGQWGTIQLELIEVHTAAPRSLADIVTKTIGIHHMAWFVDSIDAEQRRLAAVGWPEVMRAETASGFGYAFHDARAQLGHLVEIYRPNESVLRLYSKVAAAAQGWDGADPVREM